MEAVQYFRSFYNFYRHHRIDPADKTNPFKLNPHRHKLFIVKSILILVGCSLVGLYGKSFEENFIPNRGCINRMINWCCLISTLITAFIVEWESLASCKEDVQIWNTFHAIETALNVCNRNSRIIFSKSQRLYKVIFYTLISLLCVMAAILLLEYRQMEKALVDFIIIFELLSTVDLHRMLHMLLYIHILTSYLNKLKEDIRLAVLTINGDMGGKNHDRVVQEQLNKCGTCYFLCMKAFNQIHDQFSWAVFMVCLKFSIILWNEMYWSVYRAIMETSFELFCLNVVPYHFTFMSFTWSCESLYAEIKSLSQLLYMVNMNKASDTIKVRITQLMLLLDYKVFIFYTFGVYKVSYKLIVKYAISGATKVSFIAQIMKDFYTDMMIEVQ
uniref:Gustatory receptor n=1 Tax=Anopheles minimus TaxID=112268 RepID=A0A182WQI8_9DIPT